MNIEWILSVSVHICSLHFLAEKNEEEKRNNQNVDMLANKERQFDCLNPLFKLCATPTLNMSFKSVKGFSILNHGQPFHTGKKIE
jgi:hypothetical protein